jgi:hypothetical protein
VHLIGVVGVLEGRLIGLRAVDREGQLGGDEHEEAQPGADHEGARSEQEPGADAAALDGRSAQE